MMEIETTVRAFAGLGATWVMWLLVGLSVLVAAIAIERAIVLLVRHDDIDELRRNVASAMGRRDYTAARGHVLASRSLEAQVLAAGLGALPRGPAAVAEKLACEAQMGKLGMERRLGILGAIGWNAPFVGLLGTVIGIIRACHGLDNRAPLNAALTAELGEALMATAVGLLVALPAVTLLSVFQRAIASKVSRAEALGREMLSFLKDERHLAAHDAE